MASRVDELELRWRRNPDERATVALCDALRGAEHTALILEAGAHARDKLAGSVPALVAAAKMYMRSLRHAEAQSLLVRAGRLAPREGMIYRILGEVLLRRGDAERGEKVLERAIAFGIQDAETAMWLERTRVFKPMQTTAGTRAVAAEVERTAPAIQSDGRRSSGRMTAPVRTEDSVARDAPTQPRGEVARPEAARPSRAVAPPPPTGARDPGLPLVRGFIEAGDATVAIPPAHGFSTGASPPARSGDRMTPIGLGPHPSAHAYTPAPISGSPIVAPAPPRDLSVPLNLGGNGALPYVDPIGGTDEYGAFRPLVPTSDLPPPKPTSPLSAGTRPILDVPKLNGATDSSAARVPSPKELLDALALVGVFEPQSGEPSPLKWDKPARRLRWKSALFLVFMMAAFASGAYGAYRHVHEKRRMAHEAAEQMLARIDADIHASKPQALGDTEKAFGQVFDLESRSPRAALLWLRERALSGLLKGGRDVAFEDAIGRAREVQIPEWQFAFAEVASILFQGDTAGAVALLPRFDGPAEKDAFYQLFTGEALERAGDERALDRYKAAVKLDPELVAAQIALIRLSATSRLETAPELAQQFRAKYTDRPEGAALVALAAARDPKKQSPEIAEADLPIGLMAIPHAIKARAALDKRAPAEAKAEIEKGLATVDAPGMAVWLGDMAIEQGDEQLARKAALIAVSFSAVYPPARLLAARVAMLGDRLEEALKATEGLVAQGTSEEARGVMQVRAAVAYEKLDVDGLDRVFALPEAAAKDSPLKDLATAQQALAGRLRAIDGKSLLRMAQSQVLWCDRVAMDLALDTGDLETAKKIAVPWLAAWPKAQGSTAPRSIALRLSRLARYDAHLDDAEEWSRAALANGEGVGARALMERVLTLVARGKPTEVAPLLAKQPSNLGPLATWLNAYAAASAGKLDEARAKAAQLDPPPDLAPLPLRTVAALALGTMKDAKRGYVAVRALYNASIVNPDTAAAGAPLGLRAPTVYRR